MEITSLFPLELTVLELTLLANTSLAITSPRITSLDLRFLKITSHSYPTTSVDIASIRATTLKIT